MSPASPPRRSNAVTGGADGDEPLVLLFMGPGRDRELLVETLGERYGVETTTDVETLDDAFDCCVFDAAEFNRVAGTVQSRRDLASPVFLPFVLLLTESEADRDHAEVWEYVDDVIDLPVEKAELVSRIGNLIERRRTSLRLADREAKLESTIEDLKLKERAMDEAPIGITISRRDGEDDPLLYANEQFEALTGYGSDALGSDCRFLQGEETDPDTRARIREAIDANEPVSVDILNYQKSGRKFWNKLDIAPIYEDDGSVTNFVGFQTDITERKIREQRLAVLNRVLSHNLRNAMSVIQGHTALLRDAFGEEEAPESLGEIEAAATDLLDLSDTVREIERTVQSERAETVIDVDERLSQLLSGIEDRFPDATFELAVPGDDSCRVAVTGLPAAIEEAIENAVTHNDTPEPHVAIRVRKRSDEWIDVEIEDDGPGIPDQEIRALREGETSLNHADRLGLWLIYWIVNRAGGSLSVSEADPRGTVLTLSVPVGRC